MGLTVKWLLFSQLVFASHFGGALLLEEPYWNKIYSRVENHEILVSATYKDPQWSLKGVGMVKAPLEVVWKKALDFDGLKKYSKYFKEVHFDSSTQILNIKMEFMNSERSFSLKLDFEEDIKSEKRLHAKVMDGYFQGLYGVLRLKKVKGEKTEASMISQYERETHFSALTSVFLESFMYFIAVGLRKDVELSQNVSH